MSTITAIGPALDLDGPLPKAPPHSLLNTPGVVVDRDAGRWMNGVNLYPYPVDTPSLWEPCSSDEGTFRTKSEGDEQPGNPRFDAFAVYIPINCSAIGMGDAAMEAFAGRAEAVLAATISMGIEEALAVGVVGSTNPFFGDSNVTVLNSGTAVTPRIGFQFLEEAIGSTGRQGIIHATPAVIGGVPSLSFPESGMVTNNGTRVVSGNGYQGVDTPFLATPGSPDQDWIFATGPVQVYLGPLETTSTRDTLDRSDNTVVFRAERYVLAVWDTALQSAVLVDWGT